MPQNLEQRTSGFWKKASALLLAAAFGVSGYFVGSYQSHKQAEQYKREAEAYQMRLLKMKIPLDSQDLYVEALTNDEVREQLKAIRDTNKKSYFDPPFR